MPDPTPFKPQNTSEPISSGELTEGEIRLFLASLKLMLGEKTTHKKGPFMRITLGENGEHLEREYSIGDKLKIAVAVIPDLEGDISRKTERDIAVIHFDFLKEGKYLAITIEYGYRHGDNLGLFVDVEGDSDFEISEGPTREIASELNALQILGNDVSKSQLEGLLQILEKASEKY